MTTIGTLFSGFGGVDVGAMQAGVTPLWSIEYDAAIAEVAAANLAHPVTVADLLMCKPSDFERVDILHASPPCPSFSVANAGAGETANDIALGRKVAEFVTELRPHIFTLENVIAYRHSKSWHIIEAALYKAGYWLHVDHVNAADMGVPQTRKRMIVRAILGGFVPYMPEPVPWVGWYAAIEDILHTLPESHFAPWQLARLPELMATFAMQVQGEGGDGVRFDHGPMQTITSNHGAAQYRAFLMAGGGNTNFVEAYPGRGCRYENEPSQTVTTVTEAGGAMPKAWLVDSINTRAGAPLTIRDDSQPSFTVVTDPKPSHKARCLFDTGRVVAMTPRALARFQSFPDWYQLSGNARLDAKGIGNAVPPLLYQGIIASMLGT